MSARRDQCIHLVYHCASWRASVYSAGWENVPQGSSGAKALISASISGTAEAVPFVQSFSLPGRTYAQGLTPRCVVPSGLDLLLILPGTPVPGYRLSRPFGTDCVGWRAVLFYPFKALHEDGEIMWPPCPEGQAGRPVRSDIRALARSGRP
jgi:hypothetical protein